MVVIERDLRGSQSYWAWVDTPLGPLRLNVNAAQWAAIQKVDPKGAWGYGPDFDWQRLYWQMSTESGVVHAWFALENGELTPVRVELRDFQDRMVNRWVR